MSDANEQSIPSRGSRGEPVAYYVRGSEYDTGCEFEFVTLSRGHAEATGGTVKTLVWLTDEEREAIKAGISACEDIVYGGATDQEAADTMRRLLDRLK